MPRRPHSVVKFLPTAGFGVTEIVIVAAIISLTFVSILESLALTIRPINASARQAEAVYLAEEAIEAVRVLRNDSWTSNIASVTDGAAYYPIVTSGNWTLSTSDPGPVNNLYARRVIFAPVYRDASDNISTTGTLDPKTKQVTITIDWSEHNQAKSVVLETYLTNFLYN